MPSPSFFIIGAAKSGTTALYSWLQTHPDVFLPQIKEPNFFALSERQNFSVGNEMDVNYRSQFALTFDAYQALYAGAGSGQICGDASPSYLYFTDTAEKLKTFNPSAKIIALFRAPVDRIESQFRHNRRDGYEPCDTLQQALSREPSRIEAGWWWGFHYNQASRYADQWRAYQQVFPNTQLLALKYEDLSSDPERTWVRVLEFLDLPVVPAPDFEPRVNDTSRLRSVPASGRVERFIRHPSKLKSALRAAMPATVRRTLMSSIRSMNRSRIAPVAPTLKRDLLNSFEADIQDLSQLTGLDLESWLPPKN
ncbi:MAG: sulfotransferase [Hyphomonadaceae bacterium]|nr:sulfotransferase [Hyphomonadaceae bacterium]